MVDTDNGLDTATGPNALRRWYLDQPPLPVLAAMVAGAFFGGALLHLATRLPNSLIGLIGVVIGTICAWITTDYTATRWRDPGTRGWKTFVVSCALAGLVVLVVSNLLSWPFPAFGGLVALTIGVGPIVGEMREDALEGAERWMLSGLGLSLAGAIVVTIDAVPGWARLAAVIALLVGFGFFTGGLSAHCTTGCLPRSWLLRVLPGDAAQRGLLAAAVGIVVLAAGLTWGVPVLVPVGVWLIVVAMIVLSVKPFRFELSTVMQRTVLGAGIALIAVAGYQLYTTDTLGRSGWFVAFVVATIALLGAWIVWRGATLFIGVLVGFALVWGLFSNTTPDRHHVSAAEPSGDAATAGVVAFGDSFISGEGARRFFDGTDQKGADRNECRRAPSAYPALIALDEDGTPIGPELEAIDGLTEPGLDFYACSGAKLAQVLDTTPDEPDDMRRSVPCEVDDLPSIGQYPCGPADVYGKTLQIDNLPVGGPDAVAATQLVLVSIGGNDVRFGDIVAGCLLPGSCAERREVWLDNVAALGPELTKGYEMIRTAFDTGDGDGPPVVVMPYPLVLTEQTCAGSPLDRSEHEFIYEFTTVLNQQIATSARQAGVNFFADGPFAFEGHRLCESGERAINLIGLQPTAGPLLDRLNPGSWTHNSMHPNRVGHRLTADALTRWLNAENILAEGNPEPDESASVELLGVRTARPYAVAPSTLADLAAEPVGGCDFEQMSSFATRIAVFDEQNPDAMTEQPFRVPIAGADPDAVICATDANGRWVALNPSDGADDMNAPSERPTATVQDGRVFVTGGRPAGECPTDELVDGACAFQWVMFASPTDDPGVEPSERAWSLRAVRYCSTDPDCENTFAEWSDAQIAGAARKVAPPAGMIFLGGWLLALGWNLLQIQPLPNRVRLWIDRVTGSSLADPVT